MFYMYHLKYLHEKQCQKLPLLYVHRIRLMTEISPIRHLVQPCKKFIHFTQTLLLEKEIYSLYTNAIFRKSDSSQCIL